jgi:hypothetical protein
MYTLFNKELNRFLKHPVDGVWATENIEEAQELLEAAKQYVTAVGIPELVDKLTIMEISADGIN